jgi:hypothetical protein
MDSDDIALPNRFAKQVEYLNAHPECVCVGCFVENIGPAGEALEPFPPRYPDYERVASELMEGREAIAHPAATMRRKTVEQVGGYREQFRTCQNLDLYLRMLDLGQLANVPEVLLKYRIHGENVHRTKMDQQAQDLVAIVTEAYARRGLKMPWYTLNWVTKPALDRRRKEARDAMAAGNFALAKKNAWIILKGAPKRLDSWQIMLRALLKMKGPSQATAAQPGPQ